MSNQSTATKLSISLPPELTRFIDDYQQDNNLRSRSEVIARSLEALRDATLAQAYKEHAENWQHDPDQAFWDNAAISDGLDSEESNW